MSVPRWLLSHNLSLTIGALSPAPHVLIHITVTSCLLMLANFCLLSVPVFFFFPPQLTPGGKAAQAGVGVGDWVVSIDNANAEDMTHVEAQKKIRAATDSLSLSLSR